jgi:hypothetical protein
MAMDALSMIFDKAENLGILTPMLQGNPIPQQLSVYADDVILFLKTTRAEAEVAKAILDFFGGATGLRCNLNKTTISPIYCIDGSVKNLSAILNCQIAKFPVRYLGSPLHFKNSRKRIFKHSLIK